MGNRPERNDSDGRRPRSTSAEVTIAVFTGVLVLSTGASIWFAADTAQQSARDTRAALKVSERLARAAENQAVATREALAISGRVAGAAESQARTSERAVEITGQQLQVQSAGHIQISAAMIRNYNILQAEPQAVDFTIANVGDTTVRNIKLEMDIGVLPFGESDQAWRQALTHIDDFHTLARGVSEIATIHLQRPLGSSEFAPLSSGKSWVVAVAKATYQQEGYRRPSTRHMCYAFWGPPGRPQMRACRAPPDR